MTGDRIRLDDADGFAPDATDTTGLLARLARAEAGRDAALAGLRESNERYDLAVSASGVGHIDWTVSTDQFLASPRLLDMCGLPPGTVFHGRADYLAKFPFLPADRERVIAEIDAHFAGSTARLTVTMRLLVRGEVRHASLTGLCSRDAAGKLVRWNGALDDVTERHRSESALFESEQRHALALAAAGEGHWDCNLVTDQFYASPRMLEIYGFAPGTVFNSRADFVARFPFHPDDKPTWERAIGAHFAGATARFEIEIRMLPRGVTRWIHLTGLCLRDGDGVPVRWTGVVSDITERKCTEAEMRRLEEQLRLALRLEAIGTLAGGIAHDFNNILAAILGFGEMALRDAAPGSRQRRDLDSIVAAGQRGRALVERILAFSRSSMAERVPVHVEAVVREALDQGLATLPGEIGVAMRLQARHAAMLGDPTQVHQVVANLVSNAVQSMAGGGTLGVTLTCADVETARVATVGTLGAGAYVVLSVQDSGGGIAPAVRERMFDPFFTTRDPGVGTGLGLSLVHAIITELGGAIDVACPVAGGAIFTVYFPRVGDTGVDTAAPK
jgi:PAS domain S-box-containing protein